MDGSKRLKEDHIIRRYPRRVPSLSEETVVVRNSKALPSPPAPLDWLLPLPSLITSVVTALLVYFLLPQAENRLLQSIVLAFLLGGLVLTLQIVQYYFVQRKYKREVEKNRVQYYSYLRSVQEQLESHADRQRAALHQNFPSVLEWVKHITTRSPLIWQRSPFDTDFLQLRFGQGSLPLMIKVDYDAKILPDEVVEILQKATLVEDVPLTVDLKKFPLVGVRGQREDDILGMVFTLIANIAVHHSPDEVALYIISHRLDAAERWKWARWLPHTGVLLEGTSHLSFDRESDSRVGLELLQIFRQRAATTYQQTHSLDYSNRHIVLVLDNAPSLANSSFVSLLLNHSPEDLANKLRVSVLFVESPLPLQISGTINVWETEVVFEEKTTWGIILKGQAELTGARQIEALARSLAPLRPESIVRSKAMLPASIRLVKMLGVERVDQVDLSKLYKEEYNPLEVMSFPVGLNVDSRPLEVILRESGQGGHGSHAIVAGMTGAGKSVLLQALVLSMALNNSPAHLNFVLADFKGGASQLAKLQGLPHLAGFVINPNPALVERLRIALESEVLRRKTLFDNAKENLGHNVADIRAYNRLQPDNPLPHLVVVLDEFAHGLKINPNLQKAIDTIAAQGRALGVHLILSTQRPADFDDKIRPNIDIRISLRVGRKEDSKIMFNRDDAFTKLNRPGQACLQVRNNEIFEIFQAARADLPYLPEGTVSAEQVNSIDNFAIFKMGPNGHRKQIYKHKPNKDNQHTNDLVESEAEVLVAHMRAYATDRFPPVQQIALPPLPHAEALPLLPLLADKSVFHRWQGTGWAEDKRQPEERLRVPLGLIDLPAEQAQHPFVIDLNQRDGNFMVIGPSDAGVALFLRTLLLGAAATHTPHDMQLYILARGPALAVFEDLPHCGALIHSKESERIDRLFRFLEEEIERRRRLMGEYRADTMEALRTTYSEEPLPALVVIIEEFTGFHTEHDERWAQVQKLTGDSKSVDIHFVLASNSIAGVRSRLRDNFRTRMAFGQKSAADYRDILGKAVPVLDEIPGRGYINTSQDVLECQVASPAARPDIDTRSPDATIQLRKVIQAMAKVWDGVRPAPIEALPVRLELAQLWTRLSFHAHINGSWQTAPLGLDFDDLNPVTIDFNRFEPYSLVIGPPQSGKTSFLATLVLASAATLPSENLEIVMLTAGPSPLQALSHLPQVQIASTTIEVQAALSNLISTLKQRAEGLRQVQEKSSASSKPFAPPRTLVLVDDLQSVIRSVFNFSELVDQCAQVGQATGIYFIFAETANTLTALKSQNYNFQTLQSACRYGCGISFSLEESALRLLTVQLPPATTRLHTSTMGKGRALFSYQNRPVIIQVAAVTSGVTSTTEQQKRLEMFIKQLASEQESDEGGPH